MVTKVRAGKKKPVIAPPLPAARPLKQPAMVFNEAATSNNIRNWRLFRDFKSQTELWKACMPHGSITRPVLSKLESGLADYRQVHLETLAKVLNCSPGDLIDVNPFQFGTVFDMYKHLKPEDKEAIERIIRDRSSATPPPRPSSKSSRAPNKLADGLSAFRA